MQLLGCCRGSAPAVSTPPCPPYLGPKKTTKRAHLRLHWGFLSRLFGFTHTFTTCDGLHAIPQECGRGFFVSWPLALVLLERLLFFLWNRLQIRPSSLSSGSGWLGMRSTHVWLDDSTAMDETGRMDGNAPGTIAAHFARHRGRHHGGQGHFICLRRAPTEIVNRFARPPHHDPLRRVPPSHMHVLEPRISGAWYIVRPLLRCRPRARMGDHALVAIAFSRLVEASASSTICTPRRPGRRDGCYTKSFLSGRLALPALWMQGWGRSRRKCRFQSLQVRSYLGIQNPDSTADLHAVQVSRNLKHPPPHSDLSGNQLKLHGTFCCTSSRPVPTPHFSNALVRARCSLRHRHDRKRRCLRRAGLHSSRRRGIECGFADGKCLSDSCQRPCPLNPTTKDASSRDCDHLLRALDSRSSGRLDVSSLPDLR